MSQIDKPNDELIGEYHFNIAPYTRGNVDNFVVTQPEAGPDPPKNSCVASANFYLDICKAVDVSELPDTAAPPDASGHRDCEHLVPENIVRPAYFRWSNTSSDGALYTLNKEGETPPCSGKGRMAIFRSSDNALVHLATEVWGEESQEFRFDRSGNYPRRMYYVSGSSFYSYDITGDVTGTSVPGSGVAGVSGKSTLIRDFTKTSSIFGSPGSPPCSHLMNDAEGESSNDSRYWAWELLNEAYEVIGFITYDMQSDTILGTLDQATFTRAGGVGAIPRPNMVEVSPLGKKVIIHWNRADDQGNGFKMPAAYPLTFPLKEEPGDGLQYQYVSNASTHSGWAFDQPDESDRSKPSEWFVSQIDKENWADAEAGTITAVNINTGEVRALILQADLKDDVGWHIARIYNQSIRGWALVAFYGNEEKTTSFLTGKLAAIELKPYTSQPRIWRIADLHNKHIGYDTEAHASLSMDGRTVYWGTKWVTAVSGTSGSYTLSQNSTMSTYKVSLPPNWWALLT